MTSSLLPPPASMNKITFGEPKLHTDGEVLALAFGKDGWLYSVEELGILRKWNAESGQQIDWFSLSDMESLWSFSSDARVLASASDDLTIWDASSGRMLTSISQPGWVTALAFAPDAGFVATGHDDGTIGYWDAPGHHPVFPKNLTYHKKPISVVAVSPDGKRLAAASEDKQISLWNLATGAYLGCLTGHTDRIPSLAWHPSSNYLVSAGWDSSARIWDANTLEPVVILNTHALQVEALAFSRDGKWLASADSSHTIHVWDFKTKTTLHKLTVPEGEIRALAFSPDGKFLACNSDRIIHLWNPESGKPYADIGPRPLARTTVSVAPTGARLVSNGGGNAVRIWNTANRQLETTLKADDPIHALAYSPDGKWIAGAFNNQIRLWDANGRFAADWDGPDDPITTLAFSPDSTTLASGSSQGVSVWVWRVADGEPILNIQDALDGCTVESLAFHPDNKQLAIGGIDWMATGGSNGQVSVWDLRERAEITMFAEGATAVAVHPAGSLLASATLDHAICVWDLTRKELQQELLGHDGPITCLAYSPDGNWLASGGDDHTLRIWDAGGHEKLCQEVESQITSITFSPDGKHLYLGHANTTCSQLQLPEPFRKK